MPQDSKFQQLIAISLQRRKTHGHDSDIFYDDKPHPFASVKCLQQTGEINLSLRVRSVFLSGQFKFVGLSDMRYFLERLSQTENEATGVEYGLIGVLIIATLIAAVNMYVQAH